MTKSTKKIGVVIPTYERPKNRQSENDFVIEAVQSVLDQTIQVNDIVIAIDGKSTYLKNKLSALFPHEPIKVLESNKKVGGSQTRNLAFDNLDPADEFVAFLDDDDKWLPEKIKYQLVACEKEKDTNFFIFTNVIYDECGGDKIRPINQIASNENAANFIFKRDGYITTSSLLIPCETFAALRFTDGLKKHQDWDLILRASLIKHTRMVQISMPLVWYRMQYPGRKNSVSSVVDWHFSRNWMRQFKKLVDRDVIESFDKNQVLPGFIDDHKMNKLEKFTSYLSISRDFKFGVFNSYLRKNVFPIFISRFQRRKING
ncbi:glycosyltransferase family 2 protein [Oenococcus sicerae]|uniref:Glycosyltransferase n=1 Tax=Oenococcus sicerae TaxID=2203724 RepID=A0AAJ1VQA4_9LACO|nr:glycosyltransferase [Oenococcus sicerae]MDN6899962.1 glycosyltransferase [Oenococcus sicerae]QAS69579.1 glycosyltransferase family 2 protein [Oenococcus sicerae]